jgi:Zn finger protein HypA/HybF involved in hydrogenase expression
MNATITMTVDLNDEESSFICIECHTIFMIYDKWDRDWVNCPICQGRVAIWKPGDQMKIFRDSLEDLEKE